MDEKHNAGEYNIARLPDFSEFDGILLDLATVSQPDLIAEIIERAKLSSIPAISLLSRFLDCTIPELTTTKPLAGLLST